MDAITARQQQNPVITPASSQQTKGLGSDKTAVESQPTNTGDDSLKVSNETVNLSESAVKLSNAAPVTSSSRSVSIENKVQAQQSLNQLIADFQSNPSQALGLYSDISADFVLKGLTG